MSKKNTDLSHFAFPSIAKAMVEPDKKTRSVLNLNHIDLVEYEKEEADAGSTLEKAILRALNGPKNSVERLAFEVNPSINNTTAGLYKPKQKLIPDSMLKRIAIQDDLVAAIVNARANHIASFGRPRQNRFANGFVIEPKAGIVEQLTPEQKKELDKRIERAVALFNTCGHEDSLKRKETCSFTEYLMVSAKNAVTVGRLATEVIWGQDTNQGEKFNRFRATDAGTIYHISDYQDSAAASREQAIRQLAQLKNKNLKEDKTTVGKTEYSWIQVIDGNPKIPFTDSELVCHNFYPVNDIELDGYPVTPIDTMLSAVTTHINITAHNKLYFQTGRASRGMLVIRSDDVDEQAIARVKQQFNASINSVNNCLAGNTSLWTPAGKREISDILGDQEQVWTTVWTGTSWQPAMVYRVGRKKLAHLTAANGIKLECSPDHRFYAIGTDGEPVWKRLSEIAVGDYVAVNKQAVESDATKVQINGHHLDVDMAELLGWMIGDGSLGPRSLKLYYHHEKERDIWAKHAAVLARYGIPASHDEKEVTAEQQEYSKQRYGFKSVSSTRISNSVNNAEFVSSLLECGFTTSSRDPDAGKTIPSWVYTLSMELKGAFLRGFFSADGNNAKGTDPCITICHARLRQQTKELLLTLGIRVSLGEGRTKRSFGERKYVEGASFLRVKDRAAFFERVGFIQAHKQPMGGRNPKYTKGRSNRVARQTVLKYMRLVKEKTKLPHGGLPNHGKTSVFSRREHMDIDAVLRDEDCCTLTRLMEYMTKAGVEIPAWMADFYFEPVVDVAVTDEYIEMYDSTVHNPGHTCLGSSCQHNQHSLITGGFYTHQSWRMPVFAVGAQDEINWTPIDNSSRDAEFQYLNDQNARVILSAFQMAPEELPGWSYLSRGTSSQALSESNNEFRLLAARDVGIRPLIAQFEDFINSDLFPLIDAGLAKICSLRLVGLDAETPEKESVRLQQDMPVHMTFDQVLEKVEKKPVGRAMGGEFPLNPQFQSVLDKYLTVGQVVEYFFGVAGAAQNPELAYIRDPFWFQFQQLKQANAAAQQQAMQAQQAAPDPTGGRPSAEKPNAAGVSDTNQPEKSTEAPETDQKQEDLSRSIDQAIGLLTKAEHQLPPSRRRLLEHQRATLAHALEGMEEEMKAATTEIAKVAARSLKRKA